MTCSLYAQTGGRLLIFRPEPRCDGFFDVFQGILLVLSLGNAARQRGTLGNDPAVLGRGESNVENHVCGAPVVELDAVFEF